MDEPDDDSRTASDDSRTIRDESRGRRDSHTVSCRRCDREWDLSDELETVGNQAFEQFALDHKRHTGHFPDDVKTWSAVCRHCPEGTERLEESAARRWAETHVRHTRHEVEIDHATADETTLVADRGDAG